MGTRPLTELAEYRNRHDPPLSRADLAQKIGVSRETVYRWETGERRPNRKFIPCVSRLTGLPVSELMGFAE